MQNPFLSVARSRSKYSFNLSKLALAFFILIPASTSFVIANLRRKSFGYTYGAFKMRLSLVDSIEKLMIGTIFPEDEIKREDPHKELKDFRELALGPSDDITIAHNSLTAFLLEWGRALEKADGSEKLPTPIFCIPFEPKEAQTEIDDNLEAGNVIKTSRVKISFQKTKRYLSKNEQRGLEKGQMPDRKGGKIDSWSPGGILLIVQTVSCEPSAVELLSDMKQCKIEMQRLRLLAKRCDIDGDTVVKVSSERTIIRRLDEAIRVWKKMRTL